MNDYLKSLGSEIAKWFLAGALAVLAVVADHDLTDPAVWKGAALAGVAGVVKGLAARFVGDPATARLGK